MKILLGISGSIAAYKSPELVRQLCKAGHEVKIALTHSAKNFVSQLTLQTLLPNGVFDTLMEPSMQHIELAKWADVFLIAPSSANILAKFARGIADDLLSTIYLTMQTAIFIAPSMNQRMWEHMATQENVNILKNRGVNFLGPAKGIQACGDLGLGRMLEPEIIIERLKEFFKSAPSIAITDKSLANSIPSVCEGGSSCKEQYDSKIKILKHKNILIMAGPTQEAIDPVRFIMNHSSGKMGYALAQAGLNLGARITLITGPTSLLPPPCHQIIQVKSAADMHQAVMANLQNQDILIATAAVADYTIESSCQKIKKSDQPLTLMLKPTVDIVFEICKNPNKPFVVCFAAETENIIENAQQKLKCKGADVIIANDVSRTDIGFNQDENEVVLIYKKNTKKLAKTSKYLLSEQIMEILAQYYEECNSKN